MRLEGKVALVTGAARGIGLGIVQRLAEEGARVAINDLRPEDCTQAVEQLQAAGYTASAAPGDVSNGAAVEQFVESVAGSYGGRLDILVNNAGVLRDNLLFKMSEEDWDTVLDVHLKGAFLCCKAAQKYMVKQRYGKIVNLSSISALGNRGQANYSAAKMGIQGLTRTLAMELGPFNITVNSIAPGFIETEMTRTTAARMGMDWEDFKKAAIERIPLRRSGLPVDIANVALFLASDESSYVSGETIYVTGGPRRG